MVLWVGFAVFWSAGVIGAGAPPLFLLVGLTFVAFGLWNTVAPYRNAIRLARSTAYAITDRRVLARSADGERFDLPVDQIAYTVTWSGGACTVTFGLSGQAAAVPSLAAPRFAHPAQGTPGPTFHAVEDGEAMVAALEQASRPSHPGAPRLAVPPPAPTHRSPEWPAGPIS